MDARWLPIIRPIVFFAVLALSAQYATGYLGKPGLHSRLSTSPIVFAGTASIVTAVPEDSEALRVTFRELVFAKGRTGGDSLVLRVRRTGGGPVAREGAAVGSKFPSYEPGRRYIILAGSTNDSLAQAAGPDAEGVFAVASDPAGGGGIVATYDGFLVADLNDNGAVYFPSAPRARSDDPDSIRAAWSRVKKNVTPVTEAGMLAALRGFCGPPF